jgi:hypothetical protein
MLLVALLAVLLAWDVQRWRLRSIERRNARDAAIVRLTAKELEREIFLDQYKGRAMSLGSPEGSALYRGELSFDKEIARLKRQLEEMPE